MQKIKPSCIDPRKANGSSNTVYDTGSQYFCGVVFHIICWGIYFVSLRQYIFSHILEYIFNIGFFVFMSMSSAKALIDAHKQFKIAKELNRDGVNVQAILIDKWVEEENVDGSIVQNYFIGYQFSYMNYTWVNKKKIKPVAYKIMQISQIQAIRFLPRNPEISRLE
jgi:hypothetical protein